MRQDRKQKDKTAVTLVLCFCLIALVSVFAVKASIDKVTDNIQNSKTAEVVKKKAVDEDESSKPQIVDSRDSSAGEDSSQKSNDTSDFIVPVTGHIIMDYSMDMPIYQKTLDQYMTHSGVDIAAAEGTSVKACASGTVTKIDEDDKLGIIVEINHGDNMLSVYGNLAKKNLIELGEIVSKGDVIGQVGRSSLFEFQEEPHLHFEIKKGSEYVDPHEYIKGLE